MKARLKILASVCKPRDEILLLSAISICVLILRALKCDTYFYTVTRNKFIVNVSVIVLYR